MTEVIRYVAIPSETESPGFKEKLDTVPRLMQHLGVPFFHTVEGAQGNNKDGRGIVKVTFTLEVDPS